MMSNRQDQNYLKNLTVLYVEDDEETREQFSEFLSRPVGRLITATNGAEGLEAFVKHSPDIVVTDILMPFMDGLTMAYEIRGIVPTVPIIIITAFEQTDYLMRAINIGVDRYVTKPVNSYLLFECLLTCAHRLRAEEQLQLLHQREIEAVKMKHHEMLATLAGGMAHDYNNLLQGILGYVSLAKMKLEPGSEAGNYLEKVELYSAVARELGQLLNILSDKRDEFRLHENLMSTVSAVVEQTLKGKSIVFSMDFPEDIPEISYNEQQLQLVFTSLVANAVESMPSGGSLSLSARSVVINEDDILPLLPGNYLQISMIDSGTGISAEILPKIFEPYFSTKQKCDTRGMGLSLAICHAIITKHGGMITAESPDQCGSTFNIWLPTCG